MKRIIETAMIFGTLLAGAMAAFIIIGMGWEYKIAGGFSTPVRIIIDSIEIFLWGFMPTFSTWIWGMIILYFLRNRYSPTWENGRFQENHPTN